MKKVAICAVTLGRAEYMEKTWRHNLISAGCDYDLFWVDNGTSSEEFESVKAIADKYQIDWYSHYATNQGIAPAYNGLMKLAYDKGYDYIMTMANDILEPNNWLIARIEAAEKVDNTGVVAIPCNGAHRYPTDEINGVTIEQGQVIGNYLITRKAIDTVGYWNTRYGIYGPIDLDYCDRLRKAGLRTYYITGYDSKHIGEWKEDADEYQAAKKKSLNASWQKYMYAKERYARGEGLYVPWPEPNKVL